MTFKYIQWKTPARIRFQHIASSLPAHTPNATMPPNSTCERYYPLFAQQVKKAKTYRAIFIALVLIFLTIAVTSTQLTIHVRFYGLFGLSVSAKVLLALTSLFCACVAAGIASRITPEQEPILHIVRQARKRLKKIHFRQLFRGKRLLTGTISTYAKLYEKYHIAKEELIEQQQECLDAIDGISKQNAVTALERTLIKERLIKQLKQQLEKVVRNYRHELLQLA